MYQGDTVAGAVDGGLYKATLAANLNDVIDINLVARLKRQTGGNGDACLGIQKL